MYIPKSFAEHDLETLHTLMREYSFATLVTHSGGELIASHLPFMLDTQRGAYGTLVAHMARANPHWQQFESTQESLVIFQGPHTYISPSWYEVKPSVPTWNYAVVHAYGIPRLIEDPAALHTMLESLVDTHEARFECPWKMELPDDYERKMTQALVGFEITITRLEGKFKLNQNRSEADQQQVISSLSESNHPLDREVAALMRRRMPRSEQV